MSEIDVINERLRRGDERFDEVTDALSRITAHLQSQDATMAEMGGKLDKVIQGTDDVVSMWNGGVKAVRFFCRMAEAWRFMLKQIFLPIGLPALALYGLWYYTEYHRFPAWLADGYKLLTAML
jgi:hypothetical protein